MSKIVKVEYQGDIRRLPKEAPTWPFSALLSSVRSTYGLSSSSSSSGGSDTLTADSVPFLLKYVDPEGDEVTLASDDDYAEAVQITASLPSLRLKVYLKPPVVITAPAATATAQTPVSTPTPTPTLSFAGSLFQAGTNTNSNSASNVDARAVSVASDASSLNRSTSATSSSPSSSSSTAAGPAPASAANASAATPSSSFDEATASTQLRNGALAWLRQNEAQLVTALQTWLANPTIRAELVQAALALLDQVSSRVLDVHAMVASVKAALPSLRTHALIVSFEQHVLTAHRAVLAHYLSLVQPMLVFVDSAVFTNLRAPLASRLTEKLANVRADQVGPAVRKIIDRLQARVDRAQARGPHGHHGPHGHGGFGGLFGGWGGGHGGHGHSHGHGHGGHGHGGHGHGHGHGGGLFGGFGPSPLRMLPLLLSWIRDLDNPSCGNSCSSASSSSPSSSSSSSSSSTSSSGSTTGSTPGTASTTATSGIFSANSDDVPNIHYHVQCDGCGMRPLIGFRYKCTHCVNYDLCTACEAKGEHDPSHPFIKIHASSRVHAPWMGRNMMPPPWAPHVRRPHTLDPFGPTDPFSGLHAAFAHHHAHPHGGHGHGHPHGHGHGHPHGHGGHPHGHHHGPFGGHPHGCHGHHGHHGHRHGSPEGLHVDLSCSSPSSSSSSSPVSSSPPSLSSTSPALNAAIVEHVTVLEGATLEAGATVVKTWRVMNTGSHAWPANVRLIFERGDRVLSAEEEFSVVAAAPGQTVEVSAVLTAPQQSGRHAAYFRLADDDRMPFGPQFAVIVDVVGEGVAGASSSPSSSSSSASAEHPSSSQQQQQQPSSSSSSSSSSSQQPQQAAFNSRFPTQHQALREMMFFDDARNERVLELAEGELDRAVALLLDQ